MVRIVCLLLFVILLAGKNYAQKFSVNFQYAYKYMEFQFKDNLNIGDSVYMSFGDFETKPTLLMLLPSPHLQYEFRNNSKLFADFSFIDRNVSINKLQYDFLGRAIPNKDYCDFRFQTLRVGYEAMIKVQGKKSLGLNAALSVSKVKTRKESDELFFKKTDDYPHQNNQQLKDQLTGIGPFVSGNLGLSYVFSHRLSGYFYLGFSLHEFGGDSYFIDKLYSHQLGIRYELYRKTIATNQYNKNYLSVTKTNHKRNYAFGGNISQDLFTKLKSEGAQAYYFTGVDGNGDKYAYYEVLDAAPKIKTYPEFGISFFKYLKSNQFSLRTNVNWQFMNVTYQQAIPQFESGYAAFTTKDENNTEARLTVTEGVDYTFGKNLKLKPFISPACGLNIFYSKSIYGIASNHHVDYDNFRRFKFTYDVQAGIDFKGFRVGAKYSCIPGKINDFGEYKLSNFNQFKIFLHYNLLTKNINEKI